MTLRNYSATESDADVTARFRGAKSSGGSVANLWIAGVLLICFLYFLPGPTDLNARARVDTTIALVSHGTFAIDQYAWNTGDLAYSRGHWLSNKDPGRAARVMAGAEFITSEVEVGTRSKPPDAYLGVDGRCCGPLLTAAGWVDVGLAYSFRT